MLKLTGGGGNSSQNKNLINTCSPLRLIYINNGQVKYTLEYTFA